MQGLKARVRNGRLLLDEPTQLPEGTELELVAADATDELDETERAQLHDAIDRGLSDARQGDVADAAVFGGQLRKRT